MNSKKQNLCRKGNIQYLTIIFIKCPYTIHFRLPFEGRGGEGDAQRCLNGQSFGKQGKLA